MQLVLKKVSRGLNGFRYSFERDYAAGTTCIYEKALQDGSKYYCQFFSDGTAKCGMYDVNGTWHRVQPDVINDCMRFPAERRLFRHFIWVNDECMCITCSNMKKLKEAYGIDDICKTLVKSRKPEWASK